MIRTRDLVLFVVSLVFLLSALSLTVVSDKQDISTGTQFSLQETVAVPVEGAEVSSVSQLDRASVIARLKEKIQNTSLIITPQPSVVSDTEESTSTLTAQTELQACTYPDDALAVVPKWPLSGVQVIVQEGARLIVFEETATLPAQSGSSTQTAPTVRKTLLQMPLQPKKLAQSVCVPSEVIGVSLDGLLLFNRDMRFYRNVPEETRIGYARDGFPIYGVYEGETDACGGYEHPSGYRYVVSKDRDYVIGCFVASPATFDW